MDSTPRRGQRTRCHPLLLDDSNHSRLTDPMAHTRQDSFTDEIEFESPFQVSTSLAKKSSELGPRGI